MQITVCENQMTNLITLFIPLYSNHIKKMDVLS